MTQCMRIGCKREATHALKMIVPDAGIRARAAWGFLGICLCAEHSAEAEDWEDVASNPAIRMLLQSTCDAETELAFDDAYVEPVPLESREARAWAAMRPN